jgi:E3 ubiquitin-protein ligase UBR2
LTRLFASISSRMNSIEGLDFETIVKSFIQDKTLNYSQKLLAIIEPSLRALGLVNQTHAGLWKKNGLSVMSQVYHYSHNRLRDEMLNRDIICMQLGASFLDSDQFLLSIIKHFCVENYLSESTKTVDDLAVSTGGISLEYLILLSQDLLEFIIHIVCERYDVNISEIQPMQKIERQIIQYLSISPKSHSDITRHIYSDYEKYSDDLEVALKRIANFKKTEAGSKTKGTYELKEQYQSLYSPFFYHYERSEKTKSEENQMKKKPDNEKFFKPIELPELKGFFKKIPHLLDSKVFIQIVMCILRRSSTESKITSEGQLVRALYLIGMALLEEKKDAKFNHEFHFINRAGDDLIKFLNDIASMESTNPSCKQQIAWTLELIRSIKKTKFDIDDGATSSGGHLNESEESKKNNENENKEKERAIAKKKKQNLDRRQKLMAQFSSMQKNFIQNNKDLYEKTSTDLTRTSESEFTNKNSSNRSHLTTSLSSKDKTTIVCLGPNQTPLQSVNDKKIYHCILCQEDDEILINKAPMVLCCYIQSSKVLKTNKNSIDTEDKNTKTSNNIFMKSNLECGIYTTSCGHVMHASCWQKYVDTCRVNDSRRRNQLLSYVSRLSEYSCPLCETIGNTVLPIFSDMKEWKNSLSTQQRNKSPSTEASQLLKDTDYDGDNDEICDLNKKEKKRRKLCALSYDDWLDGLAKTLENTIDRDAQNDVFIINPCPLSTITKLMAETVAINFKSLFELDSNASNETKLHNETLNIMEQFTKMSYTMSTFDESDKGKHKLNSIWTNCAYTIQVIGNYK